MAIPLCSEFNVIPTHHHCTLCKTTLVYPMFCSKRGLTEMVFICIACSDKNKNNLSAESSTLKDESVQNKYSQEDSKRLKCSEIMDFTIEFAAGTSEPLSNLTTSNGMMPP